MITQFSFTHYRQWWPMSRDLSSSNGCTDWRSSIDLGSTARRYTTIHAVAVSGRTGLVRWLRLLGQSIFPLADMAEQRGRRPSRLPPLLSSGKYDRDLEQLTVADCCCWWREEKGNGAGSTVQLRFPHSGIALQGSYITF